MVKYSKNLEDYIALYNDILTEGYCNLIINNPNYRWEKHKWSNYDTIVDSSDQSKEFDVAYPQDIAVRLTLNSAINKALELYTTKFGITHQSHSFPRINKYSQGTQIENHFDHITSIFEESKKGIPVLSVVGLLNNNFQGGKFWFWDDKEIPMTTGSVLVFPSVFLYRHRVDPIIAGTRWSFVSWAY